MLQTNTAKAISIASPLVMAVATVFIGVTAMQAYDLAEQFGRIDTRVANIESLTTTQSSTLETMKADIKTGFETMNTRFDRIDLRIGQMELDPEKLLADRAMPFEKDLKPIFFGGHVYAIARSPAAAERMQSAGLQRELLDGYLPAFLVMKDAFPLSAGGQ